MQQAQLLLGGRALRVFVARSPSELIEGLKGVRRLPEPMDGMVLVFRGSAPRKLTMQGVWMGLDAYALEPTSRRGGVVVDEVRMKIGAKHLYELEACQLVLEVPAGTFDEPMLGSSWSL